jgi:hypothetical protein
VAIAHEGQATPVQALDGLPYIPSVIAYTNDRAMVGAPARAHFLTSPDEVLFSPVRHLGGAPVKLGGEEHEPESLVACLLGQTGMAAEVMARGAIDGVALSRAAWASPEARRALAAAAQRAGMNLVRTEVSTTLAAIARLTEHEMASPVVFVDVGGWKIEATILEVEPGKLRAIGRSVDATIGANWIDGRLVKALAHQVAPDSERKLLKDKLCYSILREETEAMRIELSTQPSTSAILPYLMPLLGVKEPPVWRLERPFLELLSEPLIDAIRVVCSEALENAGLEAGQIQEACVIGGLAHMPAVRDTVAMFFGRPVSGRGDVDGLAARGAALIAEASLGPSKLRVVDDLDDQGRSVAAAGWGQLIPPSLTPTPEVLPLPPAPAGPVPPPTAPMSAQHERAAGAPAVRLPHPSSSNPVPPTLAKPAHVPHPSSSSPVPPTLAKPAHVPHPSGPDHPATGGPPPLPPPPAQRSPPPPTHPATAPPPAAAAPPEPLSPAAMVESIHPTPAPRAKAADQSLPSEGTIRNSRNPAELAAIPLDGALPLALPITMPVLLLAIGRRRTFSGLLKLKRGAQEAMVSIVRGGAAGSSLEMEQLRRSFEWTDGTYKITGDAPAARLVAMRQPMVSVVVHGIRSCLRVMDIRQALDVLQPFLHEAPHVLESRGALIPLLGLSPRELRFVEHVLDGNTSADEILRRGGIGRETAVHIMFVLHLFRALEWRSVEDRAGEAPADKLRERARKLEKADHFEALGVHWSASRAEIDRALHHHEEELKPGGRWSQIEPEATAQILARIRLAHQSVAREGDRHANLLHIHPDLDFEAIESVAEDQNQWYAYRGAAAATEETSRLKKELLELSRLQHNAPHKPGT